MGSNRQGSGAGSRELDAEKEGIALKGAAEDLAVIGQAPGAVADEAVKGTRPAAA
jgi:hypothetical protein